MIFNAQQMGVCHTPMIEHIKSIFILNDFVERCGINIRSKADTEKGIKVWHEVKNLNTAETKNYAIRKGFTSNQIYSIKQAVTSGSLIVEHEVRPLQSQDFIVSARDF